MSGTRRHLLYRMLYHQNSKVNSELTNCLAATTREVCCKSTLDPNTAPTQLVLSEGSFILITQTESSSQSGPESRESDWMLLLFFSVLC